MKEDTKSTVDGNSRRERLEQELEKFVEKNEYYYKMLELIEMNWLAGTKIVHGRELHHICPKFYWKYIKQDVSNEDWNLVSLTRQDHMLCHFYLYKCIKEPLVGKSIAPLNFMKRYLYKAIPLTEDTILDLVDIANTHSGAALGTHWYHKIDADGTVTEIMAKKCPKGYSLGRMDKTVGRDPKYIEIAKVVEEERSKWTHAQICYVHDLRDLGFCEDAIDFALEYLYERYTASKTAEILDTTMELYAIADYDFDKYLKLRELVYNLDKILSSRFASRFMWYNNGEHNIRISKFDIFLGIVPKGFFPGRDFSLPTKIFRPKEDPMKLLAKRVLNGEEDKIYE